MTRSIAWLPLVLGLSLAGCAAEEEAAEVVETEQPVRTVGWAAGEGLTQDDLVAASSAELEIFFAEGRVPELGLFPDETTGTVLEEEDLGDDLVAQGVRKMLATNHYATWLGRTFRQLAPEGGRGENRYVMFGSEIRTARFNYALGAARTDGDRALLVDYAVLDNLVLLWGVKEELREVGPGVYLGRAYFETGGGRTALFTYVLTAR